MSPVRLHSSNPNLCADIEFQTPPSHLTDPLESSTDYTKLQEEFCLIAQKGNTTRCLTVGNLMKESLFHLCVGEDGRQKDGLVNRGGGELCQYTGCNRLQHLPTRTTHSTTFSLTESLVIGKERGRKAKRDLFPRQPGKILSLDIIFLSVVIL